MINTCYSVYINPFDMMAYTEPLKNYNEFKPRDFNTVMVSMLETLIYDVYLI